MSDTIEVIRHERISTFTEIKDAFEVRKDRPALWLQRLCCWVLAKLGAYSHRETVHVERHVIGKKGRRFMERLIEQRANLLDSFNKHPRVLLIGAEDYSELMREETFEYFAFDAEYYRHGYEGRKVCGLNVQVVPWMRGVLVMP